MKPIIKNSNHAKLDFLKNPVDLPQLNYDNLKNKQLKDMRKTSDNIKNDYRDVCKKSMMPLPGLMIEYDENTDNSYIPPHSDWQGPTGETWLNK